MLCATRDLQPAKG